LTYLGEWLARALAVAHQNGASLRIRSIAQDLHDAEMAAFIGNFLIAATQATGLGGIVSFGIYERNQRPIVSVVGNIGALRAAVETTFEREVNWVVSYAELDDEALVELSQWTSSKVEAY
jgi:glucose/arabinose dehydrogenase